MSKNVIRLTESDLHRIIKESVNQILSEGGHIYGTYEDGTPFTNSKDMWHGVEGTTFISHGSWSDPDVWYDGKELNGTSLEDYTWEQYKYECEDTGEVPTEEGYDAMPTEWFAEQLDEYMWCMFGQDN